MNFDQLPNFFIIGAAKSGTTSLFEILSQHPSIYASPRKEVGFFTRDERFAKGIEWYQDTYFLDALGYPVRMEATPAYLTWSQKVAPRVKALYESRPVKFTAIFRDPVKRAYSNYWHRVRMRHEDPNLVSFADAIRMEEQRLHDNWLQLEAEGNAKYGYFRGGCYASRLKPYLELFPQEDFFFLLQEDLHINFKKTITDLLRFLEIDPEYPLIPVVSNESAVPRNQNALNIFNRLRNAKIKSLLKRLFPSKIRRWVRKDALMQRFDYPPMEDNIKRELYDRFSNEIKELEKIIGRDLSHWSYKENIPR